MWFVTILFWLQAFAGPVILFGIIGFVLGDEQLLYFLLILGCILGVILAEFIRRKIGLDTFFGRIYGPNEMDDKFKSKNENAANGNQ